MDEGKGCLIWNGIQMNCSGDRTGEQCYPNLGGWRGSSHTNHQWTCKIDSCKTESWGLFYPTSWEWWWSWCLEREPFKLTAGHTLMNQPCYTPLSWDPALASYLSECSSHSIVEDTLRLFLGRRMGNLTAYGNSALASLPPQRHTPLLSLKRLNCLVSILKSVKVLCALFTQRSSASCASSMGGILFRVGLSCSGSLESSNSSVYCCSDSDQPWEGAVLHWIQDQLNGYSMDTRPWDRTIFSS